MTTMTQYDRTFTFPVVFPPQSLTRSFAEVMAENSLLNLRVAETEKYPHVSYFFNCGIEKPYPGEDRILVPSPKVATYDLQPEMSAKGITDNLVNDVEAASTMSSSATSPTPTWSATPESSMPPSWRSRRSITVSTRIVTAVRDAGGTLIVTADHGNAEEMWNTALNEPHTAHTCNPVPVIVVEDLNGMRLREGGSLRDIAPTMLGMLNLEVPKEMTGEDLRVV